MSYTSTEAKKLSERFYITGKGVIAISDEGGCANVSIGNCKIAQTSHIDGIKGVEHSKVIIDGNCVLCWSRAYYVALDTLRTAIDTADTRARPMLPK